MHLHRIETEGAEYGIRPVRETDIGFVVSTMCREARRRRAHWITPAMADVLARTLPVRVACSVEYESTVYGWVIGARGVVIGVYVSPSLRGYGIGRELARCVAEM